MNEKQISLSIKALMLAIAAYISSGIVVQFIGGQIPVHGPASSAIEQSPAVSPVKPLSIDHYSPVWEKNMFNPGGEAVIAAPVTSDVEAETAADEEVERPLSSLNYRLIGTVAGTPASSFAVIENTQKRKQLLYRIDENIGGATIIMIQRNRVILNNAGREEMLEVKFDERAKIASIVKSREAKVESKGIRKVSSNKFILDREEVTGLSQDVSKFMTQVRVLPNIVKGKPSGYKMMNIKKGSLIESIGLKNGDIVKEINGKAINKPEEAFLAYQQLKDGGGFSIEIDRKGKMETIYYEIR